MYRTSGVGEDLRPAGPRHLTDIDVIAGIHRDPVRGQETAELSARRRLAKAPDRLALVVDDAHPGVLQKIRCSPRCIVA